MLVSSAGLYLALRLHVARLAESQTELLASLSRYRELFEASPDPMWVYDFDTLSFLAVNDEAVTRYGWSEAEFRTMSLADLLDAADVPLLLAGSVAPVPARRCRGSGGTAPNAERTSGSRSPRSRSSSRGDAWASQSHAMSRIVTPPRKHSSRASTSCVSASS